MLDQTKIPYFALLPYIWLLYQRHNAWETTEQGDVIYYVVWNNFQRTYPSNCSVAVANDL